MALTARQIVRVLIGDKKKFAAKEHIGVGDALNKTFQTDMFPIMSDTVTIYYTGVGQVSAIATIDHDTGKILFAAAPGAGNNLHVDYHYYSLSDLEIDEIMSGVGTGNSLLVAANCAMALAADASRWFSYAMGDKQVNKNDIGNKLMRLSEMLEKKYYTQNTQENFNVTVATFADLPTGTPYFGYDSGIAIGDME